MPTFQITNQSPSEVKISQGFEIIYKKVYCSTSVDGDYLLFFAHDVEKNLFRQQYRLLYSDCTNPTVASATELKEKVDKIINDYANPGLIARQYIGFITQSGDSAPVVDYEILNEYDGPLEFTYTDAGIYAGSISGLNFDKTHIKLDAHLQAPAGEDHGDVIVQFETGDEFILYAFSTTKHLDDDVFRSAFIHITEYN